MDRPIRRRERIMPVLRRLGLVALVCIVAIILFSAVFGWLRPSVRRSDIRTALVERGITEATITASGNVVPEYEHVITSPIDTRVIRILKTAGDRLKPGEPIAVLDVSETRLALDKLKDRVALKEIERDQAKQDLATRVSQWRGQIEIKTLELSSLEFEAERCQRNLAIGLFSQDDLRKAEHDAERARIELRQIREAMAHAERALEMKLSGLNLELGILRKELDEASHRLELATTASDREGVLTWVVPSEGAAVRRGDEIARVADLSAFRVEATISDIHGAQISEGLPVTVRSGETLLAGRVAHVLPMVENGVITMKVELQDNRHPILRHNLRVEVYIVTARVEDALRIKRGSFLTVDGRPAVFVIRGDRAVRTPVRFGITSFEYYQVTDGLSEGEEVILTDMSDHMHVREVILR